MAGDRDILVLRHTSGRLNGFDWPTGKPLWNRPAPAATGGLALADDRVLAVGRRELRTLDIADGSTSGTVRLPTPAGLRLDLGPLAEPLCLGGVLLTLMRAMTCSNCVQSLAFPAVRVKASGRLRPSQARWVLVVSPPYLGCVADGDRRVARSRGRGQAGGVSGRASYTARAASMCVRCVMLHSNRGAVALRRALPIGVSS